MLTKLTVANFKRFGRVEIELGNPVLFIGPNNSGKTSALQALALWDIGLKRWLEKRGRAKAPEKRPGVTINRRDLVAIPVPAANLLWKALHTRETMRDGDRKRTQNVRIEILVEGVSETGRAWRCGLEFDYANEESFYCRPLRTSEENGAERMPIPEGVENIRVAFLPPMSGLAATETRLEPGAVNVRIGEGRTAEVLRNLCHEIFEGSQGRWNEIADRMKSLFGIELEPPRYIRERGEIEMSYRDPDGGPRLDLSSAGRGIQQTLLLLSYMHRNPGAVLLLDEPDAHLEILRQREIYQLLTDIARENGNQIIAASHSEVLLNEAGRRDLVIAFVGKPHAISDRGSQVRKALADIGFEDYYQAEQTGWVLYLEGSTDLAFLRAFAKALGHQKASSALERPFVKYVGNQPTKIASHWQGLREAAPELKAVAILDRLDREPPPGLEGILRTWRRREIENYVCQPETLENFAVGRPPLQELGPLFQKPEAERRLKAMQEAIDEVLKALETLRRPSPWGPDLKVSEEFLEPVFDKYYKSLGLPNLMAKKDFYELAQFVPREKLDPEIGEKLDAIATVAAAAKREPDSG